MEQKRPQGRQKHVTEGSKGVHRRGSGLGTGPVGSTGGTSGKPGATGASGSGTRANRSGGSPLMLIIAILVVLLGGGGGLGLSGVLGGGSATENYGISQSAYENILQSSGGTVSSTSGTSASTPSGTSQSLDSTVAGGSREKYTEILGGGKDTVDIMIYMCGTDLESRSGMATRDLMEMTKASLADNVNVLVYTGGCSKWNNQVISSSVNQIYQVVNGGLKLLSDNQGTAPMTKPSTLTGFIQWCNENYPANRRELIFWDHGGGSVTGYGYDEKNRNSGSMTLAGINQALKDADTTFDFIGFDACLMATVETGLMLDKYADYMVASEETEPGIGWYYTNWLTALSQDTGMATVEIGKKIVDDFVTTCARDCRGQSATLSVVDLAELSNTCPAPLKSFSESLSQKIADKDYASISDARSGTREFAQSSRIDQIDLVHFARNLGTQEGTALAGALQGAVKYNRTSQDMTNSYGLSIYFPYRKASTVSSALSTYDAIGMDSSYSQAIREFASLEISGQVATGGTSSALPSLLGNFSSSSGSSDAISSLLGSFLGGDYSSISGLSGSNADFFSGRAMSTEDTVSYISENFFDAANLTWSENKAGDTVISLPESQWNLVESLELNYFYDDGEGYVDLGLDNIFDFDEEGNLLAPTDRTWLAVNGQPVAYYHEYTEGDTASGYIPAYLNGVRVELLVRFDAENPYGYISGARTVYVDGETDTVAKSMEELQIGDQIDFVADYYSYDGDFQDTYMIGEPMTVTDKMEISNVDVGDGTLRMTFRFTDLYQQHYWTPPLEG